MAKYRAPAHISSISLSFGERNVVNGVVDLPDDLNAGDIFGLAANGFVIPPASVSDEPVAEKKKG